MTAIDWQSKPEPWRSIGREFAEEVATIVDGRFAEPAEPSCQRHRRRPKNPDQQRLAEARSAAGLSQLALADMARMSPSSVGAIEKGVYNATADRRVRLAAALGVPVGDIWP